MDKPKRKRGKQSWIEQLVLIKRLSFCSPLPLESCAGLLRTSSESNGGSLFMIMGYRGYVTISVKQVDSDHYKFTMRKVYRLWPYATLHGTLARMGQETLVNAEASLCVKMEWTTLLNQLV